MLKRISICIIMFLAFSFINTHALNNYFALDKEAYAHPEFARLSEALNDLRPGELSMCISFVRTSDMESKEIADALYKWNPEEHKKSLGVVFRSKITRLAERLRQIDYEKLIVDIDLIKNSHLTTGQIIRILKRV